jgi:hypothetical protein
MSARQFIIRLGFDAVEIESAPRCDSTRELDATIECIVYEHFRVSAPSLREEIQDFTRPSAGLGCSTELPKYPSPY